MHGPMADPRPVHSRVARDEWRFALEAVVRDEWPKLVSGGSLNIPNSNSVDAEYEFLIIYCFLDHEMKDFILSIE